MRNSIDREWDVLQKEKEDLAARREEFEREREEWKKGLTSRSEGANEISKKEVFTARSKNQLDAVRESKSELLDEDRIRHLRQKTMSKNSKEGNPLSGTRESAKSHHSEIIKASPKHHRCHGHSPETIKSVSKYRKQAGSSMHSDSQNCR